MEVKLAYWKRQYQNNVMKELIVAINDELYVEEIV